MREFAVAFEKDIKPSDIDLKNLTMNRIDSTARIISNTLFLSNDFRKDTVLNLIFPSNIIQIDGSRARHVHVDEKSIAGNLKKVLTGGKHQGFSFAKEFDFKDFLILDEKGIKKPISGRKFLLGDYKGIPDWIEPKIKNNERITLGKISYLTSQCIVVIHRELDKIEDGT